MELALLIDGVANLLVAISFVVIGRAIHDRRVDPDAHRAKNAFTAWWWIYAGQSAMAAFRVLQVAQGSRNVALYAGTFYVETALAVMAVWGVAVHLRYVWRGRYGRDRGMFAAFALLAAGYILIVQWHQPNAVVVESVRTDLAFAIPMAAATRWALVGTYYGIIAIIATSFVILGSRAPGVARQRALSIAFMLFSLAAIDALILGPEEGLAFVPVLTAIKGVVGVVAGLVYLRAGRQDVAPTATHE